MYSVYLFLRGTEFSITARQTVNARLNEVIDQMNGFGFTPHQILSHTTEANADQVKRSLSSVFLALHFTRFVRPQL